MIIEILAIAAAVAASPATASLPANTLEEASQALEAGRLEQARLMIARAVANGRKGTEIDRLTAELAFASGKNAQALAGYELANAVMISGVTAVAAGTRLRVDQLMSPAPAFEAWLIGMGGLLFLLGSAGFRFTFAFGSPLPRFLGAILCLAAVPAGLFLSAAAGLAAVASAIAVTLVIDRFAAATRRI